MSEDLTPVDGADTSVPVAVVTATEDTGSDLSITQAARALAAARHKPKETPAESAVAEVPATAEQELSEEDNAAPPEEALSEEPLADPEATPPIEPPSSWTKEAKERWSALPPETQAYLAEREQQRDKEVRRTQNEAAELRKAAEAERKQAEEARKAYEAKLPALMESLQRQSEFADIKTMEDVRKLQTEDPFRFQQWQIYQMDAQAVDQERRQAEQRQHEQKLRERTDYVREQETKLQDLIPEMKDPEKATALRNRAVAMLTTDYGFTESELGAYMQSDDGFKLLSDARLQKLIADGLKYADILKAKTAASAKPLPPVQRPGTARPAGAGIAEEVQALTRKLEASGSLKDAQALRAAQARQQRRAS